MKIAKVINDCNECQHCKEFNSTSDNYTSVYCCVYETEDESKIVAPFLLDLSTSKGRCTIEIPETCPLEDYNPIEQ
jgi:hypothetical protein